MANKKNEKTANSNDIITIYSFSIHVSFYAIPLLTTINSKHYYCIYYHLYDVSNTSICFLDSIKKLLQLIYVMYSSLKHCL